MKIVMVFDGLQVGGIERVGADFTKILMELGHEVTIINLKPEWNQMETEYPQSESICHVKYSRKMAPEQYAQLTMMGFAGKVAYPVASCVLTLVNGLYKLGCRLKNKELRTHYDVAIAFSGHFNDLTFVASKYVKTKKTIGWLHGSEYEYKIISDGFWYLYKKIKNLVCLSEMCDIQCKKFNDKYGIKKFKLYNPTTIKSRTIDVDKVDNLKNTYGQFALMVGRMEKDKDQKTAILAIKHMNEKYGTNTKLLLVGDGSTREELEKFVVASGMEETIVFMGRCSDVQNYYSAATVYVHSSPLEGLPTVLIEAMAYNLPIASTDSIPGVREILQEGKYGLISPVYDAKALGENIYRLYTDANLREEFLKGYKDRIEDFSPETIKCQLEEMLNSIV